jgi:aryl-alcohol dehydrogenase-like predicted oxidoreductase
MKLTFQDKRTLGRTGLQVGRLGISASYGAPTEAFLEAFDRGVNYLYWGSRRTPAMAEAIRALVRKGRRGDMVLVVQSYSRSAFLMRAWFRKALRTLGVESADVLLLGWRDKRPARRLLDEAEAMREAGLFSHLAFSSHNRPLIPELAGDVRFGLFHVRYNAAHRGAEKEVFPRLPDGDRPGVVTFTATRWGDLLNPKKMPPGESPMTAGDCYRFALSDPAVDLCMTGPASLAHVREALSALERGPMDDDELARARRIGDHVHAHHRRPFSG